MANYRSGRINEEVKKELSQIIRCEVKDPRLTAMISITQVEVTKDLKYAKVYVSIFGSEEEKETCLDILKSSKGFIRKQLGSRVKLRHVPELIIELDNSIEHGMHIESLINKIKENK
ncbi:30S ribosome-binding factor RbfA [Clostridium frigidicarnis]|uniref:Ribosome-binding factor A n=1 Tax=Clostridium frigidicarnis TaxID=84698 RepID=A0A1I0WN62_9CLOT|nr:30S ribosome-binding factor RbfA [Clostridium frigidicarnis]SFA89610.1 ribosome-binding factor A [Clostridium frigidicarnis]